MNKKDKKMKCENCETEFEQRHGNQKYCSTKCSKKADYQRNKEMYRRANKKWQKNNKEKLREYREEKRNAWKLNSEEEQLKIMEDFTKKELERLRNE